MKQIKININGNSTITDWQEGYSAVESLHSAHTEGRLTTDSTLAGTLNVPIAPPSKVAALKAAFPDLTIETTHQNFEDAAVAKVFVDANGGVPVTEEAFKALATLPKFEGNAKIVSFDELAETSVTSLATYAFKNCSSLNVTNEMLKNIVSLGVNAFAWYVTKLPRVLYLPKAKTWGDGCFYITSTNQVLLLPKLNRLGQGLRCGPKLLDTTTLYSPAKFIFYYGGGWQNSTAIFRAANVITFDSTDVSHGRLMKNIFINPSIYDEQILVEGFDNGNVHPIGGPEWQTAMQQLATEEGYELKEGESWADEYIDYKIYDCEPPIE